MVEESERYYKDTSHPACLIKYTPPQERSEYAIAIEQKKDNCLYIPNIVFLSEKESSVEKYNSVLSQYISELRKYLRQQKIKINIQISSDTIGLDKIISGKKSRELFQAYLSVYPRSYHHYDIGRLDSFIRWIIRYKSKINLIQLKEYLLSDIGWDDKDATWCVDRIKTGLDIFIPYWDLYDQ